MQISRHRWFDMFNTNEFTVAGVEQGKRMVGVETKTLSRNQFIQGFKNHGEKCEFYFKQKWSSRRVPFLSYIFKR